MYCFAIFKIMLQNNPLQSSVALKNYSLLCFCGSTDLETGLDLVSYCGLDSDCLHRMLSPKQNSQHLLGEMSH